MILFSKPCGECGGTGVDKPEDCICTVFRDTGGFRIADLTCPVHGMRTGSGDGPWDSCPSCVGGWLPDDGTVSAGAIGFSQRVREGTTGLDDSISAALVAAARYQSEKGEG